MEDNCEFRFVKCEIDWTIENFCFSCPNDNFCIFSPEFILRGLESVTWRLSLELEKDESSKIGLVSIYLEKLATSEASNVHVNWELKLTVPGRDFGPYERTVEFGEQNKHGYIGISTTNDILERLKPFEPDTVSIHIYFVAFDKDMTFKIDADKPLSRRRFYEDLENMKNMANNYSDVKLKIKDEYIDAHRIVLSCNEVFANYVEKAENNIIEIPQFDFKTLYSFVKFLYSQSVSYCLEYPSISMLRCMEHFKCEALNNYFIPEKLSMNSKIKIEAHEFLWYVPDIMDKSEFNIVSPPFQRLHSRPIWHLTISLRPDSGSNFISIFADISEDYRPTYYCLEFALIHGRTGERYFPRRLVRKENYDRMGFDDFVKKSSISQHINLSLYDVVRFLFKVRTSDGSQENSMGCHSMSFILPSKSKSRIQMATKMLNLLDKGIYSDITLYCPDGKNIRAHKCILIAHSPGFKEKIEGLAPDQQILFLHCKNSQVLRECIRYMYAGNLDNQMKNLISEILDESKIDNLHIPSLHEECVQYYRDRNEII